MSKIVGIIGGGQLGMMLTEAALDMPDISRVIVLDPTDNCPASQAGADQIKADFKDRDAIRLLAKKSDVITYEIESGDSAVLESLRNTVEISPSPKSLGIIQDKLSQKEFLSAHDISVPDFLSVASPEDLQDGLDKFGYPAVLKARTGGYDGRGNYTILDKKDIPLALEYFGNVPLMLERFVPYVMEISVVVARSTTGQTACYAPAENIHDSGILHQSIYPARVNPDIAQEAERVALRTIQVLEGAGVFGIEMFVLEGRVMINEIAPRVHNSGHHTLQSCHTTQFQQHLRAILGMELGSTRSRGPAIMYNILGPPGYTGSYNPPKINHPQVHLKMYGKRTSKPRRKLGHLNILGNTDQTIDDITGILESIKDYATISPKTV